MVEEAAEDNAELEIVEETSKHSSASHFDSVYTPPVQSMSTDSIDDEYERYCEMRVTLTPGDFDSILLFWKVRRFCSLSSQPTTSLTHLSTGQCLDFADPGSNRSRSSRNSSFFRNCWALILQCCGRLQPNSSKSQAWNDQPEHRDSPVVEGWSEVGSNVCFR